MVDVEFRRGTVADLHGLDPLSGPVSPVVWRCEPTDDAFVLGSGQRDDVVDRFACAQAGLTVVRRRSGGGAVIVRRDRMHWIDVVLPSGFAPDDVRGSMEWIGEHWRSALARDGLHVHRGAMICSEWSALVCFSGVGPGEVLLGGVKVVGLSQRRTRHGIRIQCLVPTASVVAEYPPLFSTAVPAGVPGGHGTLADIDVDRVVHRLAARITPL